MENNVKIFRETGSKNYLFVLHGFTGSVNDWDEIANQFDSNYNIIAISLPGHDDNLPAEMFAYSEKGIVNFLNKTITGYTNEKVMLLGYSMGGRAALSYSVNYPEKLAGLILESASPGISEKKEREERVADDNVLCKFIEENSIETFIEFWYNKPLFTGMKNNEEKFRFLMNGKNKLDKTGLINSLKGFSTGKFNLWKKIEEINIPVLLLTGDSDIKFCRINGKMSRIIEKSEYITIDSGHNIHFENPDEYVKNVNNFLSKYLLFL